MEVLEEVVLAAASGLAREVADAIRAAGTYRLAGMVDDNPRLHGTLSGGVPVLGGVELLQRLPDTRIVLCPGAGRSRVALADRLSRSGVEPERYATVVHPRASLGGSCTVGRGSIVLAGVVATADVTIGSHVVIMPNSVLTHDDAIGDFATICASASLAGGVTVGTGAYLGTACAVRENLRIGAWSLLGMGAVAIRDVPAGETYVGNPARPLRAQGRPGHPVHRATETSVTF
jgi:sugar O-acyltransferase (sialic acid O-acetyltransferase NeuD family)